MISKQNCPFSDMPVVLDLQVANGIKMGRGDAMKKKITKYMIEKDVKFGILIDECTIVSHLTVLSVCVRAAFCEEPDPTMIFFELIESKTFRLPQSTLSY
ncbi:UNVERIFIED_CONTAM: hypothetical protein FKN15_034012 [Acipenser sinensis]